ncbi:MAG: hypothetical protein WDN26_17315 [Chitinophagaceae bacterium]
MKWEIVTSGISHSVYALWNNGRKLVTLVFNPASRAARIEYADERRVFLMRKEGFLKNKTVLRNEYGVHICHAGTENNEEFIEMNSERYYYSVETNNEPAFTIYKESKDQPLAVCGFNVEEKDMLIDLSGKNKSLRDEAKYSLLMTLCWYLFQPALVAKKEKPLGYYSVS